MNSPQITTIITTYKRPKLLKRAIESVLQQTYSSFQVCVYDNASGDETREVVLEFQKRDPRVKYHCHAENLGMMGNYQYAFSQVKTPLFSFLSDDDIVMPTFYETALKGFEAHPEVMFSACSTVIVNEKKEVISESVSHWIRDGYFAAPDGAMEMIGKWIPPSAILFNSQVVQKIEMDVSNQMLWDCDFLLKIVARYPVFISKVPCAVFFSHAESFSAQQGPDEWRRAFCKMIESLTNHPSITSSVSKLLSERLTNNLKEHAYASLRHYVVKGQMAAANAAVQIYKCNYPMRFSVVMLALLVKMCTVYPKAYWLIELIKKVKRLGRRKKPSASAEDHKNYDSVLCHITEIA